MSAGDKTKFTFDKPYEVDFEQGRTYDLDAIRNGREALMPDGEHAWAINAVYAVEDPDAAMDSMELGSSNFVGVTAIHCLLCLTTYRPEIRHHKCDQTLASGSQ